LNHADVHLGEVLAKRIVEAALRDAHVKRHLTALKALDGDTGAAFLTLLAARCGFTLARANTAALADTWTAGALIVTKFVQFHNMHSLSLLFALRFQAGA
jgi:hypothetical protein